MSLENAGARGIPAGAEFDYVVVGGGTAGCILANRLSANPATSVLLVEAGGRDDWIWIQVPVGYLRCIGNPRTDWCFTTAPEAGLNGRSLAYPRGRVLGGSSSINGMIYMRGQRRDYDEWKRLGNPGWGWDDVLPHFKRIESHHLGACELHGGDGEWRVERQRLRWDVLDAFKTAAQEAGIAATDDFNRGDNEGCGYFEVNQQRGVRVNAARAFLKPIRGRRNLTVETGALVDSIRIADRRATGVRLLRDGSKVDVRARAEVVVSAGAIGSPSLLQRSGIGDGNRLRAAGVETIIDRPGVGENLQDHLQLRSVYKVSGARTLNESVRNPLRKLGMGMQYLINRSGPLSMAPSQLGIFTRSDAAQASANLQYHVQPLSLERFGEPLHGFAAITASVCNLRPSSRGHVRIRERDPLRPPEIAPNYLSTQEDRSVAAAALGLTRRIVGQAALARYQPVEYLPGAHIEGEAALIQAAGDIGTSIFHPVGTCRMGADRGAVVDARLRVHGVSGLRVVDASVMPTITSGNTNSPTAMIAEKAAHIIFEDHRAGVGIKRVDPRAGLQPVDWTTALPQ